MAFVVVSAGRYLITVFVEDSEVEHSLGKFFALKFLISFEDNFVLICVLIGKCGKDSFV